MNDHLLVYNDDGDPERIESEAALSELLEREAVRPTWVELVSADDKQTLNVGVGREFSSLTYYDMSGDGAKYRSAGTIDVPQDAEFYYGGTPTAMGSGSAITTDQAKAAASEFLRTGQRPESVSWVDAV
ncbi:Imm1 family immunity protein [Kribbella sp. NPDC056345]|uniref:Imm1 family immunity protein n=1 Tax=Kribbella sp. NPDC056345 TaxID=3345789 RepID=UPI0035E1F34C